CRIPRAASEIELDQLARTKRVDLSPAVDLNGAAHRRPTRRAPDQVLARGEPVARPVDEMVAEPQLACLRPQVIPRLERVERASAVEPRHRLVTPDTEHRECPGRRHAVAGEGRA